MAEGDLKREVNVSSEEQKSETNEQRTREFQWASRPKHPSKVLAVRPLRNGSNDGDRPCSASSSSSSPSPSPSPSGSMWLSSIPRLPGLFPANRRLGPPLTETQPFSFDARDSRRRVVREQRLVELRQEEERRLMGVNFKANPVRRYKPLVLTQSTRPLTVPRAPFSREYK